jgi:rhodanese-related sulfurtransferase
VFWNKARLVELDPADVHARVARGELVLIDVREPAELAAERIPGAHSMPLSTFDPAALPCEPERAVFSCAAGARSANAVERCQKAGVAVTKHMRGGIKAWKAAQLPTTR